MEPFDDEALVYWSGSIVLWQVTDLIQVQGFRLLGFKSIIELALEKSLPLKTEAVGLLRYVAEVSAISQ